MMTTNGVFLWKASAALTVLCAGTIAYAAPLAQALPPPQAILSSLRMERPRLLADAARFEQLRLAVRQQPRTRQWYDQLRQRAEQTLSQGTVTYEVVGGNLLATSRKVLGRTWTLAFVCLMEDADVAEKFRERLWREFEAAASFSDWHPSHFLDTAEMTHAFAIGLDWLHDQWSPEQRELLVRAIVEKGLRPALACYQRRTTNGWWTLVGHNWNQVCNGGVGLGALAIAEYEPKLAAEVFHHALTSLPIAMRRFAPEGGYEEGPGYWQYGVSYTVYLLAAMESALGTDFGYSRFTGFDQTGWFALYMSSPVGRSFNFADTGDWPLHSPQLFWLARRFDQPAFAAFQMRRAAPEVHDCLWFDPTLAQRDTGALPPDRYFPGTEVATFRSA